MFTSINPRHRTLAACLLLLAVAASAFARQGPLTDWYGTTDAKQPGFQARSVGGGVYVKMLADPSVWKKMERQGGPLVLHQRLR